MEIHVNEKALAAHYQRLAEQFEEVDLELRSRLTASDVQLIKSEAKKALALIGVTLSESGLNSYSQSIAENTQYQIVLK